MSWSILMIWPTSALADGRGSWSPPSSEASMLRWADRKVDRLEGYRLESMREKHPEFFFVHFAVPDNEPPLGATRMIDFDAKGTPNAILSIHEGGSGAFVTSCRLPCRLATLPDTEYRVGVTAPGYRSATRWIRPNRSGDKPFSVSMGLSYRDYARDVWRCWSDHQANGLPDTEATPCVRNPPKMPSKAKRSGHCDIQFDVSAAGWTDNVRALSCSDPIFETASVRAVRDWYYIPETQRGQTLRRVGVHTKMTFRLTGRDGEIIGDGTFPDL